MFERWLRIDSKFSSLTMGPRRSGKTTLLRSLFPDVPYPTLDVLDWACRDAKGLVMSLGKMAIIDEIQRHPPLTIAVEYAIDNFGGIFFMTGSSSIGLMDTASDTLAGRAYFYSLPQCTGEKKTESRIIPFSLIN